MEGTKNNPYDFGKLRLILAKIDNVSLTKIKNYPNGNHQLQNRKNTKTQKEHKIPIKGLHVTLDNTEYILTGMITKPGGIKMYTTETGKELSINSIFTNIYAIEHKSLKDFPSFSKVQSGGKYRECEGGGWYSEINLYLFQGKYYK